MAGLFVSFESAESKQDQCTNQELGLQSQCKGHVQNKDTLDRLDVDSTDMKYLKEEVWDAAVHYGKPSGIWRTFI